MTKIETIIPLIGKTPHAETVKLGLKHIIHWKSSARIQVDQLYDLLFAEIFWCATETNQAKGQLR